jgi:type II secretory pathway component PulJ
MMTRRSPKPDNTRLSRFGRTTAFTLIEVILAISIGVGLLIAALLFYRQSADMRGAILTEADKLAAVRLVMDRMTSDLRSAQVMAGRLDGFSGGSNAVAFTRASVTATPSWPGRPASDLTRVEYVTLTAPGGTNPAAVVGLNRREEALEDRRPLRNAPQAEFVAALVTNGFLPSVETTNRYRDLLTDAIRQLRLRYWDGAGWNAGWTNPAPPQGVEITVSTEPGSDEYGAEGGSPSSDASTNGVADGTSIERFRRVVFIPTGVTLRKPDVDASGFPVQP